MPPVPITAMRMRFSSVGDLTQRPKLPLQVGSAYRTRRTPARCRGWCSLAGTLIAANTTAVISSRLSSALFGGRPTGSGSVVFLRDVLVGVVSQHPGRDDAEDSTAEDIKGDRKARCEGGEQCRCDERRWTAGDDRGELVAERGAAVAQPRRKAFCDHCRLRAVARRDRKQRQRDGDKDQGRRFRIEQGEVDEAEDPGKDRSDHIHALAPDAV